MSLERLRELLHEEPTQRTWDRALDLVRAAQGADRAVYVSYLVQHADSWPRALRRLTAEDVTIGLDPLPELWSICGTLSLGGSGLKPTDIENLTASGYLGHLCGLDLSNNHVGPAGARLLAQCAGLSRLTYLNVGRSRIGDDGARALADSPFLGGLEHLAVGRASLRSQGVQDLLSSRLLRGVHTLEIDRTSVGVRGAQALSRNPDAADLRALDAHGCSLQDSGAAALASSPLLRLQRARLSQNGLGLRTIEALADGPLLEHLRHLDLTGNGPAMSGGLAALARAASNRLESLVMHGAGIDVRDLRALVHATSASHLRALDPGLEFKRRHEVTSVLLESSHMGALEELHLGGLRLSAALLLAGSPALPSLRTLYVEVLEVDPDGALQFPYAPQVARLARLRLDAGADAPALEQVVTSMGMAHARHLELRGQAVTDELVEKMANNPAVANLRSLHLCEPALGDRSAAAIARSPHLRQLEELDLRSAGISNKGAQALARAQWPRLTRLGLRFTAIGDRGVAALAAAPAMPMVTELVLDTASVTPAGFADALGTATRRQALALLRPLTASNSTGAAGVGGLQDIARAKGMAGASKLRRSDLIDVLATR